MTANARVRDRPYFFLRTADKFVSENLGLGMCREKFPYFGRKSGTECRNVGAIFHRPQLYL